MAHDTDISVASSTTGPMAYSPAAQRMRDRRERRRLGLRCVMVQVFEKELDVLISRGLLETDARNDRHAIREALHKHLSRALSTAR
jgi:hypothetical protein